MYPYCKVRPMYLIPWRSLALSRTEVPSFLGNLQENDFQHGRSRFKSLHLPVPCSPSVSDRKLSCHGNSLWLLGWERGGGGCVAGGGGGRWMEEREVGRKRSRGEDGIFTGWLFSDGGANFVPKNTNIDDTQLSGFEVNKKTTTRR